MTSPTTPLQGFPLAAGTDPPNSPAQQLTLASAIEKRVVMYFATQAARNSAISAPVDGMVAYCADIRQNTQYVGGNWVPLGIIGTAYHEAAPTGSFPPTSSNSDTFTLTVPPLATTMIATATFDARLDFSAAAGGDLEFLVIYLGGTIADKTIAVPASSAHFYRGSTPVPLQKSVTPGAHTVVLRAINHSASASAYLLGVQFSAIFQ